MATVTIGIPFYNNETTLRNAIQSVINQTFQDWLLILMNDGSTDQSLEIAKQFESKKVIVFDDGENRGLISRLNQLIDMCESPFFVRMDSDDIMVPERLEKQISLLVRDTEVDLTGSSAYIIDEKNRITGIRMTSFKSVSLDNILKKGLFIHPTVTGRTKWFKKYKYKHEFDRAEDLELWCRSCKTSNFVTIEEPLLFYRDPAKMNLTKYKDSSKTVRRIIKLYASNRKQKVLLLVKEKFKIGIYTALDFINYTEITNKRRNNRIKQPQAEKALSILKRSIG